MAPLRTYRVLSLLVSLALLFGAAAPAVHAACMTMPDHAAMPDHTMPSDRAQEAGMPCHKQEASPRTLHTHPDRTDRFDAPCCADSSKAYHPCCQQDGTTPAAVSALSDSNPRVFTLAFAGTLPDGALTPSLQPFVPPDTRARVSAFTSTIHRQAFLATFLI